MNSVFSLYSPAMRFLAKLADLIVLNLLFLVTSLPIVTLGASLTALNDTAMKLVTDRYESVSRTYLRSFRANFTQGTLLGLIGLGLGGVMWAWYLVIDNLRTTPLIRTVLFVVLFLLVYRLIGTLLFVFPYQATFENSVFQVLNNARRMSARHPLSAFMTLLVTVLPVVVGVYYPQFFVWGVVWVAFGFAAIAFVNASVFVTVFKRYGLTV